jgi:hypothetical protein
LLVCFFFLFTEWCAGSEIVLAHQIHLSPFYVACVRLFQILKRQEAVKKLAGKLTFRFPH